MSSKPEKLIFILLFLIANLMVVGFTMIAVLIIVVSKANEFYYFVPLLGLLYMAWQILRAMQSCRKIQHENNQVDGHHLERREWH